MTAPFEHIAHIDEILDRIFAHLDNPTLVHKIQLVNKQWSRVSNPHIDYNKTTQDKKYYRFDKKYETKSIHEWAAEHGCSNLVKRIVEHPKFDPNTQGTKALHAACIHDQMEVIRVLLNHPDIDPNICISVMHKLKLNNKLEMLKFCLKHPTGDPNRYSADIFFDAIKQNHWDTIELLLQHPKTIINSIDLKNEIMIRSARYDNIGSMKPLLDRFRFDIDSDICIEALCEASAKGHLEIVRLLLQRTNVDPSAFDNCAIRWAAKYGHLETVKLLLQYPNVDLRALGNDAFLRAAKHGHLEMVKFITQHLGINL